MAKLRYKDSPSENERKAFARYLAEDEELVIATGLGRAYLRSRLIFYLAWPGSVFWVVGLVGAYMLQVNLGYGLLIGFLFSILVAIIKTMHLYHSNRYLLTTRRVIIKRGYFAVQVTSALFDKITHIEVDQPFFDKVFMKHGRIIINTAGMSKDEIVLHYIDYPIEFKNLLERLINREREQFGRQGGPVVTLEGELV